MQLSDHFTYRKLLRFTLPSVVMMVFTSIYGVVDGFFVSNFTGSLPFAAINLIMPFPMILGAVGFMVGTGGNALVAMRLGQGEAEEANRIFSLLIYLLVGVGALISAAGVLLLRPVSLLLGATEEMLPFCLSYGRILLLGLVPFMLQNVFQSFMITAERPGLGFGITVAAGVANMALDALFLAVFGWGVVGAAVATVIAQAASFVAAYLYMRSRYPIFRFRLSEYRWSGPHIHSTVVVGMPISLQLNFTGVYRMWDSDIVPTMPRPCMAVRDG